ncbi:MAG TPA: isoprenylcysteine carboxylmethyltransferase family protein [Verrucomicrobiae bacterium]|nr:isoprenylcysteine carboxylmethyltransferase family protein [Verrucomicrobiae bacterium]
MLALYWFLSALSSKPVAEKPNRSSIWTYRLAMMIGAVMLFTQWQPRLLKITIFPRSEGLAWVGAAFCLFGLLGAIWSRRTLAGNWSSDVLLRQGHELIERGPYRFVRHPIYTSILLMFLGTAIAEDQVGAYVGVLFFVAGLWIKLRQEEILMGRHFPEEYPAYKKRVKALIPFVI